MPEGENPPAGTGGDQQENATIRAMREQMAKLEADAKAAKLEADEAKQKLTEKERAEMAELDRVKAENADLAKKVGELEPIRDEHGRYVSEFEGLYNAELAAITEDDKREVVKSLSASGSWPDRLKALRAARGLLGTTGSAAGTNTNPGSVPNNPSPQDQQRQSDPKKVAKMGWGEVFKPADPNKTQ